jgi:putative colanic acid biosynthesis acetyltransferase WcaF
MGSRSCLGPGVNCYSAAKIAIEADSIVSQGAHLCSASHDFRDPSFPLVTAPIVIGRGAWIAAEAFIGPGVEVGADAVVGARSVVTKNVEQGCVVAGNPAKEIGRREVRKN